MLFLVLVLLALLSLGGIAGGLGLILSPDGTFMQLPRESLAGTPFSDFTVPGFVLLAVNGVLPIIGFVLVLRRHPRAYLLLLLQGVLLSGWISVQMLLLRTFYPPLHLPYWLYGAVIFALGARMSGDAGTWWLLVSRTVLFAAAQLATFLALRTMGVAKAFEAASAWWLAFAVIANVVTLASLLVARANVARFLRPSLATWRQDVAWLFPLLAVGAVSAWFSHRLLAVHTSASSAALAIVGLLFVPTQALAELPLYFGHVAPRLARTLPPKLVTVLAATMASVQHAALPMLSDGRFLLWRATVYLPFTLLAGFAVFRRPTVLPYAVFVHALMACASVTGRVSM